MSLNISLPRDPSQSLSRAARLLAAAAIAHCCAGCAVSMPIPGLRSAQMNPDDVTGSISKSATSLSRRLDDEDWRRAKAAMGTALDPQGNGSSVAWDNPQSGAKGTFVPVAQAYPSDDKICRAFIAKIESSSGSEDMQGTACRPTGGEWDLRDAKPWKKA